MTEINIFWFIIGLLWGYLARIVTVVVMRGFDNEQT